MDGSAQQAYYSKDDTPSPTVSTGALMLSLLVDAHEKCDIATADVEGAYPHADMKDFIILKLVGNPVNIMCRINPNIRAMWSWKVDRKYYTYSC